MLYAKDAESISNERLYESTPAGALMVLSLIQSRWFVLVRFIKLLLSCIECFVWRDDYR